MTHIKVALVSAFAIAVASVAQAQSFQPTVPNPANPAPANAIATDGSQLPQYAVPASPLNSGRSVAIDRRGMSDRF